MALNSVTFKSGKVSFEGDPYKPSRACSAGELLVAEIVELGLSAAPPEIRTCEREIIFVPAAQREELSTWAIEHSIASVDRIDVWDLLLEPFLDTEFSADDELRTVATLTKCGIMPVEVKRIRKRVEKVMMAYNFDSMLWDWVHLGLNDLLDAHQGKLSGSRYRLSENDFGKFYWEAMEIAWRAQSI